jgi:hypothetical protein
VKRNLGALRNECTPHFSLRADRAPGTPVLLLNHKLLHTSLLSFLLFFPSSSSFTCSIYLVPSTIRKARGDGYAKLQTLALRNPPHRPALGHFCLTIICISNLSLPQESKSKERLESITDRSSTYSVIYIYF